jgi:hypothetical protein
MMESKYHQTNSLRHMLSRMRRQPRGQSFVELMFVIMFLALLLTGVVEYGFMLNYYLHVLDGSREAARFSSSNTSFINKPNGVGFASYYYPPFYYQSADQAASTMEPVILNPANPDDIVISVFSMHGTTVTRFPKNPNGLPGVDSSGWSLCAHYKANADDAAVVYAAADQTACTGQPYGGFASYFACKGAPVPTDLPSSTWSAGCTVRSSQVGINDITNKLNNMAIQGPGLSDTGFVLVEIFYNYPQLLKLPVLTSIVPDPMPLYVYSIMPLSSAEPTQVAP